MKFRVFSVLLLFGCFAHGAFLIHAQGSKAPTGVEASSAAVLTPADVAKIMPASVFFRGLSAPIQSRNSGGIRFQDKRLMLVSLVDTSGYSTQVQEKYQAYLITESALTIAGHTLAPGAYGCGFIAGDAFLVQDVGAHDLFTTPSTRDTNLRRPTPLQVVAVPDTKGEYRLYAGRAYVRFQLAGNQ